MNYAFYATNFNYSEKPRKQQSFADGCFALRWKSYLMSTVSDYIASVNQQIVEKRGGKLTKC
jgi:hypothetical protein